MPLFQAPSENKNDTKRKRVDDEEVVEEKKTNKRFTSKFRDLLKDYMDINRGKSISANLTNFAIENGFSFSQAKHNWYDVIVPALKGHKKPKKVEAEKHSDSEITQDDDCVEESEEEEPESVVFKSPSKVPKVVDQQVAKKKPSTKKDSKKQQTQPVEATVEGFLLDKEVNKPELTTEIPHLKPFRFETHKNRFYVFRYNREQLLYEFKGVSYSEKNFTISVTVRGLFTLNNLEFCLGDFFDMAGGVENTQQRSLETSFTLTEHLPKDIDLKSVQYGEHHHPDFGPIFVVTFDKKVSTFVPVKPAMWSTPKTTPIRTNPRLSYPSESSSTQETTQPSFGASTVEQEVEKE